MRDNIDTNTNKQVRMETNTQTITQQEQDFVRCILGNTPYFFKRETGASEITARTLQASEYSTLQSKCSGAKGPEIAKYKVLAYLYSLNHSPFSFPSPEADWDVEFENRFGKTEELTLEYIYAFISEFLTFQKEMLKKVLSQDF